MPSWGHVRHFWRPRWAKIAPKHVLEAYQHPKRDFSPNTRPRVPERHIGAQDGFENVPKSAQDALRGSWSPTDRFVIAPRSPQEASRSLSKLQHRPKKPQDRFWIAPGFLEDTSKTIAESSKISPRLLRTPSNLPCVIAYVFSDCNRIQRISHVPSGDRSWLGLQNVLKMTSMPWLALGMFSDASASDKDRSKRIQDRS